MADFTDSDDNNNGNGSKVDDNDNGDNNKDDSSNDSAGSAPSKRGAYNKPLRTEALGRSGRYWLSKALVTTR
jgi:hypothetical protein